eukprot:scaffold215510_cov33-Prasinocladus_malaysianus.AAC.2
MIEAAVLQLAALGHPRLDAGLLAPVGRPGRLDLLHLALAAHLSLRVAQAVLLPRVLLVLGPVG